MLTGRKVGGLHRLQHSRQRAHIFKVSIDGGTPVDLAHGNVSPPAISPDSASVAYVRVDGQGANAKAKFIVQKLEGGTPLQEIDAPGDIGVLQWTPDGRALTYLHTVGSARHLYMQPLSGGPPIQLTHFDTEPSSINASSEIDEASLSPMRTAGEPSVLRT